VTVKLAGDDVTKLIPVAVTVNEVTLAGVAATVEIVSVVVAVVLLLVNVTDVGEKDVVAPEGAVQFIATVAVSAPPLDLVTVTR